MKVKMVQSISGGRADGTAWPPPGGVLEVSAAEGADLCRSTDHQGPLAVPVVEERAETRPAPASQPEHRTAPAKAADKPAEKPEPPPASASKQVWVDHAVSQGADRDKVENWPKVDLQSRYGQH